MSDCEKLIELYFKYGSIRKVIEQTNTKYSKYQIFECLKIEKILVWYLIRLSKNKISHSDDEVLRRIEILAKNSKHISLNKKILPRILEHIKDLGLEHYIFLLGYLSASRKKSRNIKPDENLKDLLLKASQKVYEKSDRIRISISKPELKNALKIAFLLMYHGPYLNYFVKGIMQRKKFTRYNELLQEFNKMPLPYKDEILKKIEEEFKNHLYK